MTRDVVTAIIASAFSTGVLSTFLVWLKDRKKDAATAKLTDVQALQLKLAFVEGVADNLKKHNDNLQKDYDELDTKYRSVRSRVSELEEELDRVKRSAAQTQAECEHLSRRLTELLGEVQADGRDDGTTAPA
jgi:predicted nuclease with TOPRIM domain